MRKLRKGVTAPPSSEAAKLIAQLFHRKLTTHWSALEIEAFQRLEKMGLFADLDDLKIVVKYYIIERRKGDKGIHRRDLGTFLNNYTGEVDRAKDKRPAANKAAREKAQPEHWLVFLASYYPDAKQKDFWKAPADVQREFREWENK